jgi:hypothetical protein
MTDENRSVGRPETWHFNLETSEPKTLNSEPLNPEPR